jgi:nicotinamide-nucleotide amidase
MRPIRAAARPIRAAARPTGLPLWLSTWFGAGLLPRAPGTWGALAALPCAWGMVLLGGPWLLLGGTVATFGVGLWASARYMTIAGVDDPAAICIDEVVGQWLTLLVAPLDPIAYVRHGQALAGELGRSGGRRPDRRHARRPDRRRLRWVGPVSHRAMAAGMTFSRSSLERARRLLEACETHGLRLVTAESCTGGLIVACLTEIPGSSSVVERGYVTYDNRAKQELLGVPAGTIERVGAVSEEVARAMAEGALERAGGGLAIACTGIAGPGGATPNKPVGLVHLAVARHQASTLHAHRIFPGDRAEIRSASVDAALDLALESFA